MKIEVCFGKNCSEKFNNYIYDRIKADIEKYDLKNIKLEKSPCMGHCAHGPNVRIDGEEIINHANGAIVAERYKGQIYNKKNLLKEIEAQKKKFNNN